MARWNACLRRFFAGSGARAAGPIAGFALLIQCGATGVGRCQPYPAEGWVGVYFDRAGTQSCGSAPVNTVTQLYVLATLTGGTESGITGAEFRLEVSDARNYLILGFTPVPCACIFLGNALDLTACVDDAAGINVAFPECQASDPIAGSGRVFLGTIQIFTLTSEPLSIDTKARSPASNPDFRCPLFVRCDAPVYTMVCTTLQDGTPGLGGLEPISFSSVVNGPCFGLGPCARVEVEPRPWGLVKNLYRDAGR